MARPIRLHWTTWLLLLVNLALLWVLFGWWGLPLAAMLTGVAVAIERRRIRRLERHDALR